MTSERYSSRGLECRCETVDGARGCVVALDDRLIVFDGEVLDLDAAFLLSGSRLALSSDPDGDIEVLGRA